MASPEHQLSKRLECPLCFERLASPRLLTCGHTFCKNCLVQLRSLRGNITVIVCPLCRSETTVKGDVNELLVNVEVQSMLDELMNIQPKCRQCPTENRQLAVTYCQECNAYMCAKCQKKHGELRALASHQIVTVDDIKKGKAVLQSKILCPDHEKEGEHLCSDVCLTCKKVICMRCRVLKCEKKGHEVLSNAEYTKKKAEEMQGVKRQITNHIAALEARVEYIKEKRWSATNHIEDEIEKIDENYDDAVENLKEKRDNMVRQLEQDSRMTEQKFDDMERETNALIASVNIAKELAGKSLNAPLDGDTIAIQTSMFNGVKAALKKDPPKQADADALERCAKCAQFTPYRVKSELKLGRLQRVEWTMVQKDLYRKECMTTIAATRDGEMNVGSKDGGVHFYTRQGKLRTSKWTDIKIRAMGFLTDGRCLVCDYSNTISLYQVNGAELGVTFETLSDDEGGVCKITVDGDDLLYVSYRKPKKILVFTTAGGEAIKEIPCDGYIPQQLFAFKSSKDLVVKGHSNSVLVIDQSGGMKRGVTKDGATYYAHPAVCWDDSIIIAWVQYKAGIVSIDHYTSDLDHIRTLIKDQPIDIPERKWFYLQEFKSGDIAFCTVDKLYIFQKSTTEVDGQCVIV